MSIIIASGPVIIKDNQVLLVRHGDNFWKFCGGKVDDLNKEDLIVAAKREAREELGINIKIINPEPYLFYANKKCVDGNLDILLVHYLADFVGKITPSKEITDWSWISFNDVVEEELAPNILPALEYFQFI